MKPIYKIIIVTVVIIAVGLGIYFITKSNSKKPEVPVGPGETPAELPVAPLAPKTPEAVITTQGLELKKISEQNVFDFWITPGTKEIYYLTPVGEIFSAKEGPDLEISKQDLGALNSFEPSFDGKKIIAAFGNPLLPQWAVFDLIDKAWRPLSNDTVAAAWLATSTDEIVVVIKSKNDLNLATLNIAKNPPVYKTLVKNLRFKDVKIMSRLSQQILILEKPSAFYGSRVWQLDLKTLAFNLLMGPEKGLNIDFSNDKKLMFKTTPDGLIVLNQALQESELFSLGILPSKCDSATTSTIYCFGAQSLPTNLNLPDDYFQNKFRSVDVLYSINFDSGEVKSVLMSGAGSFPIIDARRPRYQDGSLYFINRYDNLLYRLTIK